MPYTFRNTEINNEKASNFETKSLLYLIGKSKDRNEVQYVTFDCFNDVSGVNKTHSHIWDIQSKNEGALFPKKIGTYLYTLFDNYISDFDFREYIFFCPALNLNYKVDSALRIYGMANIRPDTRKRIRTGLSEEIIRIKGSTHDYSSEVDAFLRLMLFVEDEGTEEDYIKAVTRFKKKKIKSDEFYKNVFIELRDLQSTKKNSYIENETITEIKDVLVFRRHLEVKDIELLIITRIVGSDLFASQKLTVYFSNIVEGLSIEEKLDILDDCRGNLSRAFFNKNARKHFWKLCEDIVSYISQNDTVDIAKIFGDVFPRYKARFVYLNELSVKYLIGIILEGKNDN